METMIQVLERIKIFNLSRNLKNIPNLMYRQIQIKNFLFKKSVLQWKWRFKGYRFQEVKWTTMTLISKYILVCWNLFATYSRETAKLKQSQMLNLTNFLRIKFWWKWNESLRRNPKDLDHVILILVFLTFPGRETSMLMIIHQIKSVKKISQRSKRF